MGWLYWFVNCLCDYVVGNKLYGPHALYFSVIAGIYSVGEAGLKM